MMQNKAYNSLIFLSPPNNNFINIKYKKYLHKILNYDNIIYRKYKLMKGLNKHVKNQ